MDTSGCDSQGIGGKCERDSTRLNDGVESQISGNVPAPHPLGEYLLKCFQQNFKFFGQTILLGQRWGKKHFILLGRNNVLSALKSFTFEIKYNKFLIDFPLGRAGKWP